MAPIPDTSPQAIFDQVWEFADQEYSFFGFKGIDWQAAYESYQPRVESDMTDEELFDLLAEMLFILRDGHVNLRSPFDFSRNWRWYLDYPSNFDFTLLERNYFNDNQRYVGPFLTYDFGDVLYVRYASFSSGISPENLDYLFTTFVDRNGIILDIRNNGGGYTDNAFMIADRLVSESTSVAKERFKNGPAHDAFTPFETVGISPPPGSPTWLKPFAVLTNRLSYSATNLLVTLIRDLPQVEVVGDWTGGGGGIPTFTELTNGWSLRVSAHQLSTPDNVNVEAGLPPDIAVDMDPGDQAAGIDTILETALAYIRGL